MFYQFLRRISYASSILSLASIALFPNFAGAVPPKLPHQARIHVAPFRVIKIEHQGLTALAQARYTTVDNPANHETTAFPGVAQLILDRSDFTVGCTGTLLSTRIHILTAAHCVTDESGSDVFNSGTATFSINGADEVIDVIGVNIHPDWDGDFLRGNDIAVLTLSAEAGVTGYDIDRNPKDDVASISEKIGFGVSGFGTEGYDDLTYAYGTKRNGQNKYDALADTMLQALGLRPRRDFVTGSVLQSDFDDGLDAHDAFGFFFGISDLGLGYDEVISAPGDSGGPTIKGGVVQGVTSYGITLSFAGGSTSDVTSNEIDSSFGEFSGDTRVSKYANWIDSVTGNSSADTGTGAGCSPGQARKGNC
ncbi:trypsin-like serine protease [Methylomonas sp. MgM2]